MLIIMLLSVVAAAVAAGVRCVYVWWLGVSVCVWGESRMGVAGGGLSVCVWGGRGAGGGH